MNETIKKLVLFGIGSLELSKEAITKFMADLEKEGALDRAEGKKVVKQTFKDLDKNLKKFEKGVEQEMKKWEKEHGKQSKKTEAKVEKITKKTTKVVTKKPSTKKSK